jgi:aminoglycoside phosphotransferase family enzyme/predicted kinase
VTIPAEQQATAALLERLAGRAPIETHISAVFVGADTVFKLRKAVRLSFHDFTPLAERHRTALRELELNAPHVPGLYRDVVPVGQMADGALTLDGPGEPVDWVLRMARVPEDDFLDRVAARGDLTPVLLDSIADSVAAFHQALPPVARDAVADQIDVAEGNRNSAIAAGLPGAEVEAWLAGLRREIAARAEWMRGRTDRGFVRRTHGDLHLGNLCLWQGRPVPFDALEFDEVMATTDTAYDLAFLLMDLEFRVGRPAANRVLCRYVARTDDWDLVTGLPVFLSQRAMVRAHVEARRGNASAADSYFGMAKSFLRPPPPVAIAVGGLQGTGKTTLARALAPGLGAAPGALVLRSDEIRKRRNGRAPEEALPPSAYAESESRAVLAELTAALAATLTAGHAAIADATFLNLADRQAIAAAAGATPFVGVWLEAPLAELERRIAARHRDASDATVEVLRRAAVIDPGPLDWVRVDATDADIAVTRVRAMVS